MHRVPRTADETRWWLLAALLLTALVFLATAATATRLKSPSAVTAPGRPFEVRGEVVEMGCYLRDGRRGEGHKSCALTCLKNGAQLGIVADETAELFPVGGETPASDPSAALREHVAAHVVARGRLFERAGARVFVVDAVERLAP
jgi:hypothetical protein